MIDRVSYYPGCSLEGTARDYQESIQWVAASLGLDLEELPDWTCCGASAAHSLDEKAALALGARNLGLAQNIGLADLVVPCALCFNRLKNADKALAEGRTNLPGAEPYQAKVRVWDLLDFLSRPEMVERLKSKIIRPLKGLIAVCYYGCQVARPPKVTGHKAAENPTNMEALLTVLGAEARDWSYKTDCCGASHSFPRRDIVFTLVGRLYEHALETGAECLVVSCQMCQANLDMFQPKIAAQLGREIYLPVFYFTELIGLACGAKEVSTWLGRHLIDPVPFLKSKGLWG